MCEALTRAAVRGLVPARDPASHKGVFGHVAVFAGARGYLGAARLCVEGACRSGAGLATLGAPESVAGLAGAGVPEAMTLPLPESAAGALCAAAAELALAFVRDKEAAAVGPGLTVTEPAREFALRFMDACPAPLVIDADGLNALGGGASRLRGRAAATVLTPHPGEMARLLETGVEAVQSDRLSAARALSAASGAVAVLKGAGTIIAAPDGRCWRNTSGNPGMAKGGTGDVLTGVIAGLLAQGLAAEDAARLGVFLHGLAGDIAAARHSAPGMLARDLLAALPAAWLELLEHEERA